LEKADASVKGKGLILIEMRTIPHTIWEELHYTEMTGILKDPSIKIKQLRILRVSRDVMLINPFFNAKQY
jgi:hypothetical protein